MWFYFQSKDINAKKNDILEIKLNSWLIALLCYGNFSYCLGRSADGNFGVMLPYFAMGLFVIYQYTTSKSVRIFSCGLIASMIVWSLFPGTWQNYKRAIENLPEFKFAKICE